MFYSWYNIQWNTFSGKSVPRDVLNIINKEKKEKKYIRGVTIHVFVYELKFLLK